MATKATQGSSWKEMTRKGEDAPLTGASRKAGPPKKASNASFGAAKSPAGSLKTVEEADLWDSGFTLREMSPLLVRSWLAFQVVSLLFQALLWREVSGHLVEYDSVVLEQCSPEHRQHGICVGPMWKLASYQDAVLSGSLWSERRTFQFSTLSNPPTFLIAINPVTRGQTDNEEPPPAPGDGLPEDDSAAKAAAKDARWSMEVVRVNPPHTGSTFQRYHNGQQAMTFEDFSVESANAIKATGRVEWKATLSSRSSGAKKTRYLAFVEDAAMSHLADIHGSPQCAFGKSWKAFNEHHQGTNHRALSWCNFLLGIFLLVGGAAVYVVHSESSRSQFGGNSNRFHAIVVAKFFLQDVPQQTCIVLYVFGWYEASGLRCQLCLFKPEHCVAEDAFHFANMVALVCTLLSSMANQLLIRPVFKKKYTEDDVCMHYTVRIAGVCISVLPFTTGMCFASRSLLPMPTFFHVAFMAPCIMGWLCLTGFCCLPVLMCCEEDYL